MKTKQTKRKMRSKDWDKQCQRMPPIYLPHSPHSLVEVTAPFLNQDVPAFLAQLDASENQKPKRQMASKTEKEMTDPVKKYLSTIGRKGGSVMSAKKLAALKRNARKPRPGARKDKAIKPA